MSDTVIQVENLGKKYVLGHQQQGNSRYVALRDVLADGARALGRRLRHPLKPQAGPRQDEFWALKDVSFEVKQGEVVGIIGRNGAGKSTLLKVLSRITEPTTGRVRLRGRVASLLEVGTGFHPELTGRENIFLNGAILGMSRTEINRKFDEIVDFAEVERFLDTPVKRYSSGMYVRLAFAVAAHMEPEILVVDEVLAVGDSSFQKKCLGRMETVSKEGRTVLFVSHNMATVQNLCSESLLLESGAIIEKGKSCEVIGSYLKKQTSTFKNSGKILIDGKNRRLISSIKTKNSNGDIVNEFMMGDKFHLEIDLEPTKLKTLSVSNLVAGLSVESMEGIKIFGFHSEMTGSKLLQRNEQCSCLIHCFIDEIPLLPGKYWITVSITRGVTEYLDRLERILEFSIVESDVYGKGFLVSRDYGLVYIKGSWE
ncbi:ABC transporter ATP-binding protein [Leptolyngbya sp. KIOST-1]|uniref:ABC transporter ATP-binding protein n=1 Tax=Leptolyngbya sp. KIOST-1 TaxID=1229172 RepID=UPI000563A67B|nr:ABC transporter ATP-binding protein [Leptolyngbya sp. KIOST-1]